MPAATFAAQVVSKTLARSTKPHLWLGGEVNTVWVFVTFVTRRLAVSVVSAINVECSIVILALGGDSCEVVWASRVSEAYQFGEDQSLMLTAGLVVALVVGCRYQ